MKSIIFIFLLCTTAAIAEPPALTLTLESQAVVVSGATPGTDVAIFGVAQDWGEHKLRIVDYSGVVPDNDNDGVVRFAVSKPIPYASFWVAVDMRNGRSSAGGTARGVVRKQLPRKAFRQENSNRRAGLQYPFENALVWVVRPGGAGGAWVGAIRDGDALDRDSAGNGLFDLDLDDLTPLATSRERMHDYRPGDLVFVIDPIELEMGELQWQER